MERDKKYIKIIPILAVRVMFAVLVGYVEIPDKAFKTHVRADTRKGVSVEYLTEPLPA